MMIWPLAEPAERLFVTGVARCGSSWIGQTLSTMQGVRYNYEPFNPAWSRALRGRLRHYTYAYRNADLDPAVVRVGDSAFRGSQNAVQLARAAYRQYLWSTIRPAHCVLVKDPTAALMTDWICHRYLARVLVVVRHPCGFASSIHRLGWPQSILHLLSQESLMEDYLAKFEDVMRASRSDEWMKLAAIWGAVYTVLYAQSQNNPNWTIASYEDACEQPQRVFRQLASQLKLRITPGAEQILRASTTVHSNNPATVTRDSGRMASIWEDRLSKGQIDAVMGVAREFNLPFYPTGSAGT